MTVQIFSSQTTSRLISFLHRFYDMATIRLTCYQIVCSVVRFEVSAYDCLLARCSLLKFLLDLKSFSANWNVGRNSTKWHLRRRWTKTSNWTSCRRSSWRKDSKFVEAFLRRRLLSWFRRLPTSFFDTTYNRLTRLSSILFVEGKIGAAKSTWRPPSSREVRWLLRLKIKFRNQKKIFCYFNFETFRLGC